MTGGAAAVAATSGAVDALARCTTVFLPGDPARTGVVAFWRPEGGPPPGPPSVSRGVPAGGSPRRYDGGETDGATAAAGDGGAAGERTGDADGPRGAVPAGALGRITVVGEDGRAPRTVTALLLPVAEALPVLTRARRSPDVSPSVAFWGAAALDALRLVARGLLLPGLSPAGHDAWRAGPLGPEDLDRLRILAASMPPEAHGVPLGRAAAESGPDGTPDPDEAAGRGADVLPDGPVLLPEPEALLRSFADAVADTLPRTPAAVHAAGGTAFAATAPRLLPSARAWAADVAAGHDAGVRLSLRIELTGNGASEGPGAADSPYPGGDEDGNGNGYPRFRAVLQMHSAADVSTLADAAEVWAAGDQGLGKAFGPRARLDALLALRRAARAWNPLTPLLHAAVPDAIELADEEVAELLGGAARALAAGGVAVHWPRESAHRLTTKGVIGTPDGEPGGDTGTAGRPGARAGAGDGLPSLFSGGSLPAFGWSLALGDRLLSREELDVLAEAKRPLVRLRDQWVLVDPEELRRVRLQPVRRLAPADVLGAVLTGSAELDGRSVEVVATGWAARLRDRLTDPEGGAKATEIGAPAALAATLRDYQLRGLNWLHRMTSLGLGGCLADDMGLGKTITLIALHLHRQTDPESAGPALVVCPASLLGNWRQELARFAPGTPVRRYHGASRDLEGLGDGEFVLTTYGTMRLDAERLGAVPWGLVVADEAQHVKNPYSATARRLRTIGAKARVALTGTPVENNLTELWAILDWTTPGLLGGLGAFRTRYARAVEGGTDPAAARRLSALVAPFLLRRRKSDPGVAPELPPKTETDRSVSLTPEQAGLYEAVVRETLAAIAEAGGMERRGLVVKLLTSLKQICNHPAQYLKEERPRLTGRSGKLELLDELLGTILAEGASVLVFTQYVRMARLLESHLAGLGVRSQLLHGGTPVPEREAMVERFQRGEVPVFLLSLKAAGTGLNLTRAGHVVHFDRWWNPAVEAQATDRAYRIGQTQPVQVHRLIAEGTVEDRIAAMLARKKELADSVLGTGEAALTELTDAELAELVRLRGADG
jgi:superfamily II DNA or RNA helicase